MQWLRLRRHVDSTSFDLDRRRMNTKAFTFFAALIGGGGLYLVWAVGGRQAAVYLIGALIGICVYRAEFSFASAWRRFIVDKRGAGLRAQMVMLALGVSLFFPALAAGTVFGMPIAGRVSPAGMSVAVGAFIFGVGMQLGDLCACGTLYNATGGGTRWMSALAACVAGSLVATAHLPFWSTLPSFHSLSLIKTLGVGPALLVNWTAIGAIAVLSISVERRRYGSLLPACDHVPNRSTLLYGPWSLTVAAVALSVMDFAILCVSGKPWGVMSAFALWGAKAATVAGFDVGRWTYWTSYGSAAGLAAPLTQDVTSVTNVGIALGAMLAAAHAGRYAPVWRMSLREWLITTAAGFMLGYGARLAYGSNIGSYIGGILSGSIHGWLWFIAAFIGNIAGLRLRTLLGLRVGIAEPASRIAR
jgi:uncharacterized protein